LAHISPAGESISPGGDILWGAIPYRDTGSSSNPVAVGFSLSRM